MKELEAFKNFGVYEEVKDDGQERLSSRWVMTDKSTETERKVKARLVCRGFEEAVEVQADSPTGSKETLQMLIMGDIPFTALPAVGGPQPFGRPSAIWVPGARKRWGRQGTGGGWWRGILKLLQK